MNLEGLTYHKLEDRPSKVSTKDWAKAIDPPRGFTDFLDSLPNVLGAETLREVAKRIVTAHFKRAPVALGYGAHVVKTGLSPLIADMIRRGIITAVYTNGAGAIHELEFVLAGKTSEDVDERLPDGTFGFASDTIKAYHSGAMAACHTGRGLGYGLGCLMHNANPDREFDTILGAAFRRGIPAGISAAIGTDIIYLDPDTPADVLGKTSFRDFEQFCGIVADMQDGVFINLGSSVIIPEVFLKAVSVAINLGNDLSTMTTVNMDMSYQYRPTRNVVERPPGDGFQLIGHHEIMFPLLRLAVLNEMKDLYD